MYPSLNGGMGRPNSMRNTAPAGQRPFGQPGWQRPMPSQASPMARSQVPQAAPAPIGQPLQSRGPVPGAAPPMATPAVPAPGGPAIPAVPATPAIPGALGTPAVPATPAAPAPRSIHDLSQMGAAQPMAAPMGGDRMAAALANNLDPSVRSAIRNAQLARNAQFTAQAQAMANTSVPAAPNTAIPTAAAPNMMQSAQPQSQAFNFMGQMGLPIPQISSQPMSGPLGMPGTGVPAGGMAPPPGMVQGGDDFVGKQPTGPQPSFGSLLGQFGWGMQP